MENYLVVDGGVQRRNGRRVVLLPLPLQGHINPMLQLANILYSKGFTITIIHIPFNSPNPTNYPHFTFLPISSSSDDERQLSASDISETKLLILRINSIYPGPIRECLADQMVHGREPRVACLITDAMWYCSQAVADGLNLPRIVLRTSSIASFLLFTKVPVVQEKGYANLSGDDAQSSAIVPELAPLKFKDIRKLVTQNPKDLEDIVGIMVKETKAASGIIWNTFQEFEEDAVSKIRHEFPNPSFPIGPFHKYFPASSSSLLTQDTSVIPWLDSQAPKSVLYVSFGSIAGMEEPGFLETARGLASSGQPFVWVIRPGSIRGSEWIENLPQGFLDEVGEVGRIVKWGPQQEILAHPATGGFWTHNGWNSTLESICEGVPMLCSPSFGDQPINARYITDVWKVGLMLENGLERGEIESAIKELMVGKEGERMRERMMDLKEKAKLCLKEGGSGYESLESLVRYILSF